MIQFKPHLVNGGRIERDGDVLRLILPPTPATEYADAQVDDYDHGFPRAFANVPPQRLRVRARFSHSQMKGTAGFGFWNHPFARDGGVIAPPRNVWFFSASPESNMQLVRGVPGHGFKAAMLNSPPLPMGKTNPLARAMNAALRLGLGFPLAARALMAAARAVVSAREAMLGVDMTQWHDYQLDWRSDAAIFSVDGTVALRAPKPPCEALGFVAWVDNYRATATSSSGYEFAFVETRQEQWMELEFAFPDLREG